MHLGGIEQVKNAYKEKLRKTKLFSYLPAPSNILKYRPWHGGEPLMNLFDVRDKRMQIKKEEAARRDFLSLIDKAKTDWQLSLKILSEVTDADLMDYVIYLVKANEARYRYLLKVARKEKISCTAWQS